MVGEIQRNPTLPLRGGGVHQVGIVLGGPAALLGLPGGLVERLGVQVPRVGEQTTEEGGFAGVDESDDAEGGGGG